MDFIKQAFTVKHEFWRYLVGSLIIAVFAMLGQIPFTIAAIVKHIGNGGSAYDIDESKLMTILEPNLNLFLLLLSFAFGFVGLIIVVKNLHKQSLLSVTTARPKIDWKRVLFSFLFWGVISSGMVLIDYYGSPENYVWNFELNRFLILVVIAVLLVPIQTSLEEYIFRGYLMQGFGTVTTSKQFPFGFIFTILSIPICSQIIMINNFNAEEGLGLAAIVIGVGALIFEFLKKRNAFESEFNKNLVASLRRKWVPLLITSVIFGGMHVFNPEVGKLGYGVMVYYIGTGLFLGVLTLMDDGMELSLGFHAANNLFGALLVTADWTVLQTHSVFKDISEPEAGFGDIIIPVFVVFPILLFIFAKVYKWTNWKEKLFGNIEAPVIDDNSTLD
ncbi:CPBP family intramembrane glutamic endopeptidase [Psychroserpens sp. NJDZ02]|uniref:CPBP family intramembrane glutamic endopeptidase n=1 Tax=Psychroserpens sp. NJDZ02 TaxID=2570561 RepID=UPI001F0E7449|nr:CPBP family intramembrane glutamic endopeptidase [Psychroserpens sp. NJDZ02]